MKNLILFPALLLAFVLCFHSSTAQASAKTPKPAASFEESPAFSKLDLRSREAWRKSISDGESGERLECFIKTSRPASADDKALLAAAGFRARTFTGQIATGEVSAGKLRAVAELDFVSALELAVPLSTKKP